MNSIRLRLLLSLMALLGLAALVIGGLTYRAVLGETETLFDYQLRQMALSLRDQGEISADQVDALSDQELDFVVQIWTVDGRSIYASRPHSALPTRARIGLADVQVGAEVWRTFGVVTRDRVIQVAQPLRIRSSLAAQAALRSALPLAGVALPMALMIWWLVSFSLRPLRRLAEGVTRRDADSLQPLAEQDLPDELRPLAAALNALLQRLGRSLDTQRAFVADAAHELRSPLTALKLQVGLLRRAPDAGARVEAVASLAAGIERAARLVEQLLVLARSEPGAPTAAMEDLELGELVRNALVDTAALAIARGSELSLDTAAPAWVLGERAALAALARNLADNALRYSPAGARVEVRVAEDGQTGRGVLLQVDDSGPGIPAADRERVFDRFYRRQSGDAEGSGLGLAIVRAVADRHRARVELGDSPLGGLRVTVRFARVVSADPGAVREQGLNAGLTGG